MIPPKEHPTNVQVEKRSKTEKSGMSFSQLLLTKSISVEAAR